MQNQQVKEYLANPEAFAAADAPAAAGDSGAGGGAAPAAAAAESEEESDGDMVSTDRGFPIADGFFASRSRGSRLRTFRPNTCADECALPSSLFPRISFPRFRWDSLGRTPLILLTGSRPLRLNDFCPSSLEPSVYHCRRRCVAVSLSTLSPESQKLCIFAISTRLLASCYLAITSNMSYVTKCDERSPMYIAQSEAVIQISV